MLGLWGALALFALCLLVAAGPAMFGRRRAAVYVGFVAVLLGFGSPAVADEPIVQIPTPSLADEPLALAVAPAPSQVGRVAVAPPPSAASHPRGPQPSQSVSSYTFSAWTAKLSTLERENAELKSRLAALEARCGAQATMQTTTAAAPPMVCNPATGVCTVSAEPCPGGVCPPAGFPYAGVTFSTPQFGGPMIISGGRSACEGGECGPANGERNGGGRGLFRGLFRRR